MTARRALMSSLTLAWPRTSGSAATPTPVAQTSLSAMLDGVRKAEPKAIAELYDRFHGKVYAFARRLTGDEEASWDLVQEVFLAAPKAFANFRGDSSVETFLLSITVHRAQNHLRGAVRRRKMLERAALEPERASDTPEKHFARTQLRDRLRAALDSLSIDHQTVFVLCDVEERTSIEVAELLSIPEATVRTRLFYARKKLRALFADPSDRDDGAER